MPDSLKYLLGAVVGAGLAWIVTKESEGQRAYEEGIDDGCRRPALCKQKRGVSGGRR